MQRIAAGLISLFCLLPSTAFAEVENWYTYWAIGGASHYYPGNINAWIDIVESQPDVDRTQSALDLFGFYWPYNHNTALGFVVSATADRLENSAGDYIQINQYLYGLSAMHFFGREIGDGFYLRGDVGVAKLITKTNLGDDAEKDAGAGILLGFGYAWAVTEQSRVLFGVSVSSKDIEGETYSSSVFTVGGLW